MSDSDGQSAFRDALLYVLGSPSGFALMGLLNSSWPLIIAISHNHRLLVLRAKGRGGDLRDHPFDLNAGSPGRSRGWRGAYGNVGAVFYLFVFIVRRCPRHSSSFIAAGALLSWVVCLIWLKEPEGGFGDEYVISSVDREIAQEAAEKRAAQAEVAALFAGSEKFELTERSGRPATESSIPNPSTNCVAAAWPDFRSVSQVR